ncbi:MAG: type II secretion system protein [Clostridia bacterium]|nr:type II secretion system protein [Clostridia bacterium]
MKKTNKKGFTIVELVIVIAVIAILSAVLIPTFGSVISEASDVAGKQDARNGYLKWYAEDIKDGVIDAELDGTALDTNYTSTADGSAKYTHTASDGTTTYAFDGSKYYKNGTEMTND